MLEMIYGDKEAVDNRSKVLFHETIDGVEAVILNVRGSHPCAYINVPKENWEVFLKREGIDSSTDATYIEDIFEIYVHGGITYSGDVLPSKVLNIPGNWLGWDYAHCDDFTWNQFSHTPKDYEHAWKTKEIYDEIVEAIKELKKNYPTEQ